MRSVTNAGIRPGWVWLGWGLGSLYFDFFIELNLIESFYHSIIFSFWCC